MTLFRNFSLKFLILSFSFISGIVGSTFISTPAQAQTPAYVQNITGMRDSPEENQKRSIETGTAGQYLVGGFEVDVARVNTTSLVREINDLVRVSGKYYKAKPDYKGTLITSFVFYPGYKKSYQIKAKPGISDAVRQSIDSLNKAIASETQCSPEGFCAFLAFTDAEFVNPDNPAQKLNAFEFSDFLSKNTIASDTPVFHNNPEFSKPIFFVFYQGVNGYLTPTEFVHQDLVRKKLVDK